MWWQNFDLQQMRAAADRDVKVARAGSRHVSMLSSVGEPSMQFGAKKSMRKQPEASFTASKRSRPTSAPALLRGERPFKSELVAHPEDEGGQRRQEVERIAVNMSKSAMKQEAFDFRRELESAVAADPCFQDLQVRHNSAVRARTATAQQRPRSATAATGLGGTGSEALRRATNSTTLAGAQGGATVSTRLSQTNASAASGAVAHRRSSTACTESQRLSGVQRPSSARGTQSVRLSCSSPSSKVGRSEDCCGADQVKMLCSQLQDDIAKHCERLGLPADSLEDGHVAMANKLVRFSRFVDLANFSRKANGGSSKQEVAVLDRSMTGALKGRLQQTADEITLGFVALENPLEYTHDDEALAKLAEFFLSLGKPLRQLLTRMDKRRQGRFRLSDWERGLAELGFKGNCAQAFRLLDTKNWRVISNKDVEAQLCQIEEGLAEKDNNPVPLRLRRSYTIPR